ncbi:Alpha/Beta hydrolase protein [Pilobolus umbonatus]|nr:Alpha/Beta hydrolase protein [Pilobolus umbonatus]
MTPLFPLISIPGNQLYLLWTYFSSTTYFFLFTTPKMLSEGQSEPFTVPHFTPDQQRQLKEKTKDIIWPNELEQDNGWDYGAPTWAVKPLLNEWVNEFNWEDTYTEINRWHHYRMKIDGLLMHYIHEPSTHPQAIPLVLLHGWPSTFYEFHHLITPLSQGGVDKQAFHVIVPSLPGFGFSEAPKEKGYGIKRIGKMINDLMVHLGYKNYMYHGSDWGAIIGRHIAVNYTENCKAFHTNMPITLPVLPTPRNILFHPFKVVKFLSSLIVGYDRVYSPGTTSLSKATFANVDRNFEAGYRAIQGTKPYTLAYGLSDSPVGLLAWMLEKYHEWTYHPADIKAKEGLPQTLSSKDFLSQLTLYWMTNTMSSSIRIYYEVLHKNEMVGVVLPRVKIPVAVCAFAHEIMRVPQDWIECGADLQQYNEVDMGGHFPGLELPDVLLNDIQSFGSKMKKRRVL